MSSITESYIPIPKKEYIAMQSEKKAVNEKLSLYEKAYKRKKSLTEEEKRKIYDDMKKDELLKMKEAKEKELKIIREEQQKILQTEEYKKYEYKENKKFNSEKKRWNADYDLQCKLYEISLTNPNLSSITMQKPIKPPQTLEEYYMYLYKNKK